MARRTRVRPTISAGSASAGPRTAARIARAPGSPSRSTAAAKAGKPSPSHRRSCNSEASRNGGMASTRCTAQPAASSRRPASSNAASTSGAICMPSGRRQSVARRGTGGPSSGAGTHHGSRGSGAARATSPARRSAMLRPMGPDTAISCGPIPRSGPDALNAATRPSVGRSPCTPQAYAGYRMEPPMSVPCARCPIPDATAAAAPPDEPPGVSAGSRGLRVAPCSRLLVNQRSENAGVLVRPRMTAPARSRLSTTGLLVSATKSRCPRRPLVVAYPAWSVLTFTVTGTPASTPGSSPRATASSTRSAWASTSAGRCSTTAFNRGLTSSSRTRAASAASRAETSRPRMRAASAVARKRQSSVMPCGQPPA